jgi:hypothetical protein
LSIIVDLAVHDGGYVRAVGGLATVPDLPATMEVDYIRVYHH